VVVRHRNLRYKIRPSDFVHERNILHRIWGSGRLLTQSGSEVRSSMIGVSVPAYNRESLLRRLVSSIPEEIPVFVSDNGGFLSNLGCDFPINVFISPTENKTVLPMFENWNRAIALNTCEWIVIPSDDDMYFRGAFDAIRSEIAQHPDVDVFVFGHENIDEDDRVLSSWTPDRAITLESPNGFRVFKYGVSARMPSVVFRRKFLGTEVKFDDYYTLTAADSELVQRLLIFGRSRFVPKVISGYRIWQGSLTSQKMAGVHWMAEVDRWTFKLNAIIKDRNFSNMERKKIVDTIYGNNLAGAISRFSGEDGIVDAYTFLRTCRYPWFGHFKTQARIVLLFFKMVYLCAIR